MISLSEIRCTKEQERRVLQVLRSGHLVQGPLVAEFEQACREMAGTEHAVAVNSGTAALEVAFAALDIGPGDEIVTSPLTFAATLNAALGTGARVRFADITDWDYTIDPRGLATVMSGSTKAVVPVHLYGQPSDLDPIAQIASAGGATIVEDAAQAHGATLECRPVGGWGLGVFSFYATKNLFAGEGGVVTTNDDRCADRMRTIRNQGMRRRYDYEMVGRNLRLTDLAAAVALPQFDGLSAVIDTRREHANRLTMGLDGLAGVVTPAVRSGCGHVWHQYTIRVTQDAKLPRDAVMQGLLERGIGSGVYYPRAVYDYACYREHPNVDVGDGCPTAERVTTEVLSLPVHQHLSVLDVETVVGALWELLG